MTVLYHLLWMLVRVTCQSLTPATKERQWVRNRLQNSLRGKLRPNSALGRPQCLKCAKTFLLAAG